MRNTSKVCTLLITIIVILMSFTIVEIYGVNIGVSLDGEQVVFTADSGQPFIDKANRTQVPLRVTMEASGCIVTWDNVNKIASVEKNGTVVKVPVGFSYITVNGVVKLNDTAAQIKDGRTYLPIRAVLEAFGANVTWNSTTSNVEVITKVESIINSETINYEDGTTYIGYTKYGIPDGTGTLIYTNGDTYTGDWSDGIFDGSGTYIWADGDKYTGDWKDGQRTGYGTYVWADGEEYTGEWKDGEIVYHVVEPAPVVDTSSQNSSGNIVGPLSLYSDETVREYLGKLTSNEYDSDSIFNEYGAYGSKYRMYSIWNEYGAYGSEYRLYSAFNKYTSTPPLIIDGDGNIVGRLTVNPYVTGAISPYVIKALLIDLGF